jgi:hypothetical protein
VQLASAPSFDLLSSDSSGSSQPASRLNKMVAAGVAVVGAGAIALNPVQPLDINLPDVQVRAHAVQLAAAANPVTVWAEFATTTFQNLQIGAYELSSRPLPILSQLVANQVGYAGKVGSSVQASFGGLQTFLSELPSVLQQAAGSIASGDVTGAYAVINSWALIGLAQVGYPLYPILDIPGEMAQNFANVVKTVFSPDTAFSFAHGLLSPPVTTVFQISDIVTAVSSAVAQGNLELAVNELVNAPAKILNAAVNGFTPSISSGAFPGLLSPGGPFAELGLDLPRAIADALRAGSASTVSSDSTSTLVGASGATSTTPGVSDAIAAVTPAAATVTLSLDPAGTERTSVATDATDAAVTAPSTDSGSAELSAETGTGSPVTGEAAVTDDEAGTEEETGTEDETATETTEADATEAEDSTGTGTEDEAGSTDADTDTAEPSEDTGSDSSDGNDATSDSMDTKDAAAEKDSDRKDTTDSSDKSDKSDKSSSDTE